MPAFRNLLRSTVSLGQHLLVSQPVFQYGEGPDVSLTSPHLEGISCPTTIFNTHACTTDMQYIKMGVLIHSGPYSKHGWAFACKKNKERLVWALRPVSQRPILSPTFPNKMTKVDLSSTPRQMGIHHGLRSAQIRRGGMPCLPTISYAERVTNTHATDLHPKPESKRGSNALIYILNAIQGAYACLMHPHF